MAWRLAKSIDVLRKEINAAYPKRRKSSDGTIGDDEHASRSSDHNPWVKDGRTGVVTAIDFTHDPDNGVDAGEIAELLRASKDTRIKYIISNKRICNSAKTGGAAAWSWRPYSGSNPHTKHMHLSVKSDKKQYDSIQPWKLELATKPTDASVISPRKKGEVETVQEQLTQIGYFVGEIDDKLGSRTIGAIASFKTDWNQPGLPVIDANLKTVLQKAIAEHWKRPIAPERATATSAELAPKLPEVGAALTAERAGWWAAITTGASAVITGVAKTMGEAVELLNPLKTFIADLPWPVWVGGALGVSVALYFISRKSGDAANAATAAYQEGSRV